MEVIFRLARLMSKNDGRNLVRLILSIACSCFVFCNSRSQTWHQIPSQFSTGDTSFDYYEAAFVSKNIGWYITQSLPSKIFKTTDGGYHWNLMKAGPGGFIQL